MAYDASNNKDNAQQVAGAAPLSQGGTSPMAQGQDQNSSQGPSTPATVQPGQSPAQQPNKPASSGMFTNIQNYVQKNQPAAQKMSGAVSQNIGNQAAEIGQAAAQKKATQDAALQANKALMDKQKQEAASIIQQQTGVTVGGIQPPQPADQQVTQTPVDTEKQAARFQQLMGAPEGLTQVNDINLSQQNLKAQTLNQMAQSANTEQGRQNLLKQTFQGQTPSGYTRGMSGLDQLVVSGDQGAREQMIKGTQAQAQQLNQQIQDIGSEANKSKMANDLAISKFGTDISGLSEEAQNSLLGEVDSTVAAQQAEWQNQTKQMQEQAASEFQQGLKYGSAEDFYKSLLNQDTSWNKSGTRNYLDNALMQANLLGENVNLSDIYEDRKLGGLYEGGTRHNPDGTKVNYGLDDTRRDFLNKNIVLGTDGTGKIGGSLGDLLKNASDYGIDVGDYTSQLQNLAKAGNRKDVYGWSGHQDNKGTNVNTYDAAKFKEITGGLFDQINKAKDSSFQKLVENKYKDQYQKALGEGQTFDDFISGKSIDRSGAATEDQVKRLEALQKLTGAQTNALGTETGRGTGQDTALFQSLKGRLGGTV